jgi:two-component system CheB/CheR fusion protein
MLPYSVPSSSAKGAVTSFLDVTALHQASRMQAIIDALAEHIAVLTTDGVITLVNKAWMTFAAENGNASLEHAGVGSNYMAVFSNLHEPADSTALAAQRGVADVLAGRTQHFSLQYPCHSPTEQRWFVMHVSALSGDNAGAVVSHINISEWHKHYSQPSA